MNGKLPTWSSWPDAAMFSYSGSVTDGVLITYGNQPQPIRITADQFKNLRHQFAGQTVVVGTSRDNPPPTSLGEWMQANFTQTAVASYVAPILIHEGFAEPVSPTEIRFIQ